MAQKNLFNLKTKGSKASDSKILDQKKKRKTVSDITYVTGDNLKDAVLRAASMSKRILGKVLDRLELVTTEERLDEYLEVIIKNGKASIDSETTGLDTMHDIIAGLCLYTEGEKGIYIPLNHISHMTHGKLKSNVSIEYIKKFLQKIADLNIKTIYHNAKFDMEFIYWHIGVKMNAPWWDTMIASFLLNENEPHNLKVLHKKYVLAGADDVQEAKFNSLFQGITFTLIPPETGYMYAAYDPIMTWELAHFQLPYLTPGTPECSGSNLERVSEVYYNIELPLIPVLMDMEITGVTIDVEYLAELRAKFQAKLDAAQGKFDEAVSFYEDDIAKLRLQDYAKFSKLETTREGKPRVSISSPTQLAILLYDVLGLKSNDQKKPRGTGADILDAMNHPVTDAIREYRQYDKLMSTYMSMDKHQSVLTGRVHTNYKQYGAATGRMSSEEPNLQNIPARGEGKIVRQVFTATKGYKLVGSDYSQQEPRALASLSNDANMIQSYVDQLDLYAVIGSKIYKVPYEECQEHWPDGTPHPEGKKRRNSCKSVLLGQH